MQNVELPLNSPMFKPAPPLNDTFWERILVELDFSIIGAPKSGTSWLFYCLNQHSDLFIPGEQNAFTLFQEKGAIYYNDLYKYATPSQKLGDYSSSYMVDPHLPEVLAVKYPGIKLIIVCRNPIERAFSHYLMDVTSGKVDREKMSFRDTLLNPQTYSYYDVGLYFKHISRFLKYIKRPNLLILTTDEIHNMPESTIHRVFDFLEVDRPGSLSLDNQINTWQSNKLHRSTFMTTMRNAAKRVFPEKLHDKVGHYYMTALNAFANRCIKIPRPKIPEADKALLKEKFYPENRKLETVIGADLSSWDA